MVPDNAYDLCLFKPYHFKCVNGVTASNQNFLRKNGSTVTMSQDLILEKIAMDHFVFILHDARAIRCEWHILHAKWMDH